MIHHSELHNAIRLAKQGDKGAEHDIFEYLRVRFIILAKKRMSGDMAEDIAHEACLTVFEKFQSIPADVEFLAWAYKILRNKIGSHMRKSSFRGKILFSSDAIEDIIGTRNLKEDHDFRLTLMACLRKLSKQYPKYIRIINLSNQGYTADEICKKLKIRPNYFYVLLHRCRSWLYTCIFAKESDYE